MNSIQSLAALISGSGLLVALLAIPLILRRVPPNTLYGVRTKAAFASDVDWYRINAQGGRYLLVSGLLIVITGVVGFFLPASISESYSLWASGVSVAVILIPCIRLSTLKPASPDNREDSIP